MRFSEKHFHQKRFRRIYLELTNACNLSCDFCPSESRPATSFAIKDLEKLIPELARFTGEIRPHILGEPLLYPDFSSFLDLCAHNDLTVKITTNGTLLDAERKDLLIQKPIKEINFSLQSFSSPSHKEAMDYINAILDFSESKETVQSGIYINFRFWNTLGGMLPPIHTFLFESLLNRFGTEDSALPAGTRSLRLAEKRRISFDEIFEWPDGTGPGRSESGFCHGAISHIGILSDGTAIPCCLDYSGRCSLGNIFQTPIEEIVQGDKLAAIAQGFESGARIEPLCRACSFADRFSDCY